MLWGLEQLIALSFNVVLTMSDMVEHTVSLDVLAKCGQLDIALLQDIWAAGIRTDYHRWAF